MSCYFLGTHYNWAEVKNVLSLILKENEMQKIIYGVIVLSLSACADKCECEGIYASPKLIVPPNIKDMPTAQELQAEALETKKDSVNKSEE
jgi:hypothetical protein